ncbi:MAG: hypothetical protein GTO18_02050 [Anaerolineales bacterium]|nr:hypothetical protein [Anaerolineales bacterium]
MQTPAGTECPYYYADYFRGRNKQTCRLIEQTPNGGMWSPDLCSRCRVPRIVLANACPNMVLEARAKSGFLGIGKNVEITATCTRSLEKVKEPEIGCGLCHEPFPPIEMGGEGT